MGFVLGALAIIIFIFFAISANKYILPLIPGVILLFLAFAYSYLFYFILKYFLIWIIPVVIIVFKLNSNKTTSSKIIKCTGIIILGCLLEVGVWKLFLDKDVYPIQFDQEIKEVALLRDDLRLTLSQDGINLMLDELKDVEVKKDFMEKCSSDGYQAEHYWYEMNIVFADKQTKEIIIYPRNDEPDLMAIRDNDDDYTYYQAKDSEADLGGDWINNRIENALKNKVKNDYDSSLKQLKQSIQNNGSQFTFTVPSGLPEDTKIKIIGLPDEKNSVVYFLDENNDNESWVANKTYTFDVSSYQSYRFLYVEVKINDETFGLKNLFEMLPENMKSENPQERFHDAGI